MAMEWRGNRRYPYLKKRTGTHVASIYIRGEEERELADQLLAALQAKRQARAQAKQDAVSLSQHLRQLAAPLETVLPALMAGEGWMQSCYEHRSCWRRSPWLAKERRESQSGGSRGGAGTHSMGLAPSHEDAGGAGMPRSLEK
ncbi:MAG: hypothetical protein RhofKO_17360 [Rhodothermales bacterium]